MAVPEPDEWDDVDGEGSEYDEEAEADEDGADAEAEEIARRLGAQLWADINKAQADRGGTTSGLVPTINHLEPNPRQDSQSVANPTVQSQADSQPATKQEEAAIATVKAILSCAARDALVLSVLSSTVVPECNGQNVLDLLNRIILDGAISKEIAKPLGNLCLSLARSEILFSRPRQYNTQPDKGKRKWDEAYDTHPSDDPRASKKAFYAPTDLQSNITAAVRIITDALTANPSPGSMNAALIASIQLQLHQIFLFAVTSSAGGGPEMNALQEISGLIQVIGVLSGIQISSAPPGALHDPKSISFTPSQFASNNNANNAWLSPAPSLLPSAHPTDIGTAVYPCLIPSCRKVFSRLYNLRAHQRMHAVHRPFRCSSCPASFARNHDLKRHAKLHDKRAWKCCGCNKVFSRRDAIKRHKKGTRTRGSKEDACLDAEVVEVDLAQQDESLKEGRRAKIWSGIVGSQPSASSADCGDDKSLEEGEVDRDVVARTQAAILSLHGLLQSYVATNLGLPPGHASTEVDPAAGQATLASVIARAQWQNLPMKWPAHPKQVSGSAAVAEGSRPARQSLQPPVPGPEAETTAATTASLSRYGLSEEQTKMLELAIANAASAAQAQAEAEAALEEDDAEDAEGEVDEEYEEELMSRDGEDDGDGEPN